MHPVSVEEVTTPAHAPLEGLSKLFQVKNVFKTVSKQVFNITAPMVVPWYYLK